MSRSRVEPSAIVQSVHDAAMREINALEKRIVRSEDDADSKLWEQAAQVVALLDGGMTQRALAKQWTNARTGQPYAVAHVNYVKQAFVQFTEQPRPRFRDAYNAAANGGKTNRLLACSGNNEWYTPAEYTRAAADVMTGIDLDPASCDVANETVGAVNYYTKEVDGLTKDWPGRVWLNPPYSQPLIGQFCAKLIEQHAVGITTEAIVLVNNSTDTAWFQTLLGPASAVCLPNRRIRFMKAEGDSGSPLQGQAVIYLGRNADTFATHFAAFGPILRREYGWQPSPQTEYAA